MSMPKRVDDIFTDPVTGQRVAAADTVRYVTWHDLPLVCPMPNTSLWNGHPRIALPIHISGREHCPYCGTLYILRDPVPGEPAPHFTNLQIEHLYRQAVAQCKPAAET